MVLDCTTSDTALRALAAAADVAPAAFARALRSVAARDLDPDDPCGSLPRLAAKRLDIDLPTFSEVRVFHGSRTRDPGRYWRDGVRPLDRVVDQIWLDLETLLPTTLRPDQWRALREAMESGEAGHFAALYAMKMTSAAHHGPYALLVPEQHLRGGSEGHDYLGVPEIVEDIAHTAAELFGVEFLEPYRRATAGCIVAFDVPVGDVPGAVAAACWYVRDGVSLNTACSFDARGTPVPATAIRAVEVIGR